MIQRRHERGDNVELHLRNRKEDLLFHMTVILLYALLCTSHLAI